MRPKTIKHSTGEITFKNINVEERNEIIEKIKGPKMVVIWDEEQEEYILVPEIVEKEEVVVEKDLPEVTYAFSKVGAQWCCVEVKFNSETKDAQVINITQLHSNRNIALDKFRVKFFKNI